MTDSEPRLKTFTVLVLIFVAPLTWALTRAHPNPAYLSTTPSVASCGGWAALALVLYFVQRSVAKALGWKMHDKSSATHREDLFRMAVHAPLLCVAGRVGARLDVDPLLFGALVAYDTAFFGVLFEMVRDCNIEFTRDCVSNPYTLCFAAFVSCVLTALAVDSFVLVDALASSGFDLISAIALTSLVLGAHAALSLAPGQATAHWHHWYLACLGALFCPFNTLASQVAHAMLLAIYLHGAALFGIEPCFADDEFVS